MPFDSINGEVIEGLDASAHVVVDWRRLAEMGNLLVEHKTKPKFRVITERRPLFADAWAHAADAFARAGALLPIVFDPSGVMAQVYPKERKVAVIFQRKIADGWQYVTRFYDLPYMVIQQLLEASGKAPPTQH